jgi:hypothetical protein
VAIGCSLVLSACLGWQLLQPAATRGEPAAVSQSSEEATLYLDAAEKHLEQHSYQPARELLARVQGDPLAAPLSIRLLTLQSKLTQDSSLAHIRNLIALRECGPARVALLKLVELDADQAQVRDLAAQLRPEPEAPRPGPFACR